MTSKKMTSDIAYICNIRKSLETFNKKNTWRKHFIYTKVLYWY